MRPALSNFVHRTKSTLTRLSPTVNQISLSLTLSLFHTHTHTHFILFYLQHTHTSCLTLIPSIFDSVVEEKLTLLFWTFTDDSNTLRILSLFLVEIMIQLRSSSVTRLNIPVCVCGKFWLSCFSISFALRPSSSTTRLSLSHLFFPFVRYNKTELWVMKKSCC